MLDNLNIHPSSGGQREPQGRPSTDRAIVGDREIPINVAGPFEAMHRWLDGEASEVEALRDNESARYVELWRRVGSEIDHRRLEAAPTGLVSRVMSAIPGGSAEPAQFSATTGGSDTSGVLPSASAERSAAVAPPVATFWNHPVELSPAAALAAAAGLVALGLAVGAAIKG